MARLVAVCRDGDEDFPFLARQIPLYIDDTLTMVMEFSDSVMNLDSHQINSSQMKQFVQYHSMLKQQELNVAMMVTSREVFSALTQLVPCVGCRRSVERLFSQLVESGNPALEPLTVKPTGVLSATKGCVSDARKLFTLFYVHGSKLNGMIDAIPKSKKNKRCQLHSLDTHKPKPLGGSWMDVWELMSQECRDEVVLIDSACLLETLETYLRKHRFCTDCKNKVLRAYNILVGELDCSKEKGYCAALYEGLRCCPHERHVHVCCETDFIAHLLGRAEPEFAGGYERRERHAKTIDIAQEEVLTCLGIHLYERLHRIWQKLRAEEQTWQMLFYLGIDALRKSFEMAVEKVQGISRLEQLCEELSEEERAKELKQEKKRQKRKNRRKNKCGFDVLEQEAEGPDKDLDEGLLGSAEGGCKACGSPEEQKAAAAGRVEVIVTNDSTSCSCPDGAVPGSPKAKKGNAAHQPPPKTNPHAHGLSPHSNVSDCGYSSSMEGSETGSREGSDVACTEGICNHDEAGDYSCGHRCAEDKEEDGVDSCVECWAISEGNTKGKNKKKKRKNKGMCSDQGLPDGGVAEGNRKGLGDASPHTCRTKQTCSTLCCETFASIALQLPWAEHRKSMSQYLGLPEAMFGQWDASASLMELLDDSEVTSDEENCLTQDEIQAFVKNNKSFYNNRDQYRQHLKEKFTNYCLSTEQIKPVCGAKWFATTTGVN
ncbi:gametogenetin-binding protein 2 isoform X1 [Osmerus mordax]|uniref:gametogenetin-binding protein 2 isoform X1 n=1 Tax=Osmerus mordax TaxID=8014 RepID=UPI003510747B